MSSKINDHHRLHALNKPCFSETEDELSNQDDQIENIVNNENNKIIVDDNDHVNDLCIILKKAIKNNDRDLMMCAINYLNMLESNLKKYCN